MNTRLIRLAITLAVFLCTFGRMDAWVYPEHRDIALQAVVRLDANRRSMLDTIWQIARRGYEDRLTPNVVEPLQGRKPTGLDWAAWSAIGGDHSCSPQQLLDNVLRTDWIIGVADIAARLKEELAAARGTYARVNALRDADISMQRTDPEYATRAGSNNVHFLLARSSATITFRDYAHDCLIPGAELNAIGAYAIFHEAALAKAVKLRTDRTLTDDQRRDLALAMLAEEAFALHFLEDTFASGHVAGTWGDASIRKGTHDYYCEHGMEITTWDGTQAVIKGDAYMRPADAERAAATIRESLGQLMDAYSGVIASVQPLYNNSLAAFPLNVCSTNVMPSLVSIDSATIERLGSILRSVPVSGLADGSGSLPRFRAELGGFVGFNSGARVGGMSNGFNELQTAGGAYTSLDINLRLGVGLEGVLNEAGDGLVFVEGGMRIDGASTQSFYPDKSLGIGGAVTSAVPSRNAYQLRLRMPFWLVPGDLILAAPILLFAPDLYTQMAVVAGNGGVIPWQSAIATPIGRFQIVLGREIGASFYGYDETDRAFMPVQRDTNLGVQFVGIRSLYVDIPLLEYKPFRSFASNQSSGLTVQFFTGVDIPISAETFTDTGASLPGPTLRTVVHAGFRFIFDWRYYW